MSVTEIIVSLSLGKDSLATLDVCKRQFKRVEVFTMTWIPGWLSFQKRYAEYLEKRYNVTIYKIPWVDVPQLTNDEVFTWHRPSTPTLRYLDKSDLWDHCRRHFGIKWIATGERITDNFERGSRLRGRGKWDAKFGLYHPLADWTETQVLNYLKLRHIPLPPRYTGKLTGYKDEMISGEYFFRLKLNYPEDYQKILDQWPFLEAIRKRFELHDKRAGEIQRLHDESRRTDSVPIQSAAVVGTKQEQVESEPETGGAVAPTGIQQADGAPGFGTPAPVPARRARKPR